MIMTAYVEMFCGAGLFGGAWHRAGFDCALAVDLDPEAIASYRRNVSVNAKVGSAADVPAPVACDVLVAGPPCQGFSTLGRRDPTDRRNSLSSYVADWAQALSPKVVVVENVPPFLQSAHWSTLTERFRALGYGVDAWVLDAADFGAPQIRQRSFTIASRVGRPNRPAGVRGQQTVREALSARIDERDPMHVWPEPSELAARRIALVPEGGDKRDVLAAIPELCPPSWSRIGCQATDAWGRMVWDKPANTLRCCFQNPSKGRYLHPVENRVISLREGARIQGVPDQWEFVGTRTSVARQIGNGVPLQLGEAIAGTVSAMIA